MHNQHDFTCFQDVNRGFRRENTRNIIYELCFGRKASISYILSEGSQNILEVLKEMSAVTYIINEDDAETRKNKDEQMKKDADFIIHECCSDEHRLE